MTTETTGAPEEARARDEASPLGECRDRFLLPEGMVYLDGNSLGALPRGVPDRVSRAVTEEWGRGLIASWNDADWINLSRRVADKIGPLIGAKGADVHVGDSTSVTLFKTLAAACRLRPGRTAIVIEPSTFPTDGYVAAGVARLLGLELRWCDPEDPARAVDENVAVVCLTHVDFRTGAMYDMGAVTRAVHDAGALMLWDLCHSAGAVPVELAEHEVDFAVGCTYKYLNGGPGSPAFVYVAPEHHGALDQPITGWMGHAHPFDMDRDYLPAPGVTRMASGTPPILALTALDAALDAFDGVDQADIRATSLSLTGYFIELVDARLDAALEVITPRGPALRGSQVSLRHDHAYGVVQALIDRGVVGDFRTPDVARFGFAPMYVRHVDVYDAVEQLVAVVKREEFASPSYDVRNAVT